MSIMTEPPSAKRRCLGSDCENNAGTLQCPTCLKLGVKDSYFCSQDCFKRNWASHKALHKLLQGKLQNGHYNPFPTYSFTGSVRPVYPLSPRQMVPKTIRHPDWSETGIPKAENRLNRSKIDILDAKGQEAMRKVCRLAREVLDITAAAVRPGVTTDQLDEICHNACIEREVPRARESKLDQFTHPVKQTQSYPSPLNYNHFPKSLCTSPNEVICHGIPDHRPLEDGDILNLDISLYHGGFHADVNETYHVGPSSLTNSPIVRLIETTRQCLDLAIDLIKPGRPFKDIGAAIETHATSRGCSVVKTWGGHGIGTEFHPPPWIPHYARNRAVGLCRPGMAFTVEPILTLGLAAPREVYWPDDWTNVTTDGGWAAQFEHTLLVTETGVEVLTARREDSPGGPVPMPSPSPTGEDGKVVGEDGTVKKT